MVIGLSQFRDPQKLSLRPLLILVIPAGYPSTDTNYVVVTLLLLGCFTQTTFDS